MLQSQAQLSREVEAFDFWAEQACENVQLLKWAATWQHQQVHGFEWSNCGWLS